MPDQIQPVAALGDISHNDVLMASATVIKNAVDNTEAKLFLNMLGLVEDDKG